MVPSAPFGGRGKGAAGGIGHHQRRAVVEAGGCARLLAVRRGGQGDGDHFSVLDIGQHLIQRAGPPVVDIHAHAGDAEDGREGVGDALRGGFRRGGAEDVFAQLIGLAQSSPLPAGMALAHPEEDRGHGQHAQPRAEDHRGKEPTVIEEHDIGRPADEQLESVLVRRVGGELIGHSGDAHAVAFSEKFAEIRRRLPSRDRQEDALLQAAGGDHQGLAGSGVGDALNAAVGAYETAEGGEGLHAGQRKIDRLGGRAVVEGIDG